MNWSAAVLSSVTSDTEPTIVVNFDSAKYIFNVGENTNRAFLQSRRNWRKTRGIFLTSIGTQRASGLPGLLMSLADGGLSAVDVIGPEGLLHFLAAMRLYAFRESLALRAVEGHISSHLPISGANDPEAVYKDDNITVYAVPVSAQDLLEPSSVGLKRKRTPSPVPVYKRSIIPSSPETSEEPTVASPSVSASPNTFRNFDAVSIHDLVKRPDFAPEELDHKKAQEWRKLIVQSIFSGDKPPSNEDHKKLMSSKKKEKRKGQLVPSRNTRETSTGTPPSAASTSDLSQQALRVANTPGFRKQLPRFTLSGSGPSQTSSKASKTTLAYVLVGPRVRGKFDAAKAQALGLQPGPLRGKVSRGETVHIKVDDGHGGVIERVVRPEDCVAESESPGVILILDTPTTAHIPPLTRCFTDSAFYSKFRSQREEDNREYSVRTVFHICGPGVLEDHRYKIFMHGFNADVHHLVASREHGGDPVTFTSAAFNQLRLNQLDPEIFPIPYFSLSPPKDIRHVSDLPQRTAALGAHMLIDIRPPRAPIHETGASQSDSFHPAALSSSPSPLSETTLSCFSEAKRRVAEHASTKPSRNAGDDVTVLPLGTGSAMPTKYRNVSGTLLRIPKSGNILLDAGEGTWGQLTRHFGTDTLSSSSAWQVLRDLKCIFISHVHADHHIGLAKILSLRQQLDPPPTEPLYLVANRPILLYLHEYSDVEDLGLFSNSKGNEVKIILSDALHWRQAEGWNSQGSESWMDAARSQLTAKAMCQALRLESFSTVDVYHRTRCYGAVIKHTEGWSTVYSGDTMPTNNLVLAGKNATLLIHEATMADDQAELARAKAHSTFGQAVDVGRRMNTQHILLTHFSARYPKMPPSTLTASVAKEKVQREPVLALAFDHANLTIGTLWKMKYYLPAIEQSFLDTAEEGDEEQELAVTRTTVEIDIP